MFIVQSPNNVSSKYFSSLQSSVVSNSAITINNDAIDSLSSECKDSTESDEEFLYFNDKKQILANLNQLVKKFKKVYEQINFFKLVPLTWSARKIQNKFNVSF